jgi:hydroxypyruvate isomerase
VAKRRNSSASIIKTFELEAHNMNQSIKLDRRQTLTGLLVPAAMGLAGTGAIAAPAKAPFKQGICRMILGDETPVETCCQIAQQLGAKGFDFMDNPKDWPTLKRYGLTLSLYRLDYGGGSSLSKPSMAPPGWNSIGMPEAQGEFLAAVHKAIDVAADNGFPTVAVWAGTRDTVTYEQGADNAVAFMNLVKDHAEKRGVTIVIELLNSLGQVAPPKQLYDHLPWGLDVVRRVNSPRFKLLYDTFHAQLMDGNIVDSIRKNIDAIGHFHVAGLPGRHELDDTQELNFRLIGRTIAATGYTGFVSHEWDPSNMKNGIELLRKSMAILAG